MTHFTCKLILLTFLVTSFNLHAEIDSDSIRHQLPDSLRFSELDEMANKTFLVGRFALSVYIDDLFDSCYRVSTILLNGRKATLREKEYEEMRKAGVSLSYNFNGGIRSKKNNSGNSLIDELNRVNL